LMVGTAHARFRVHGLSASAFAHPTSAYGIKEEKQ
jgi:hypothetical protein